MHVITDIQERIQGGQSDRGIARDLHLSRLTVRKYREQAVDGPASSEPADTSAAKKDGKQPGRTSSTVLPYQAIVEQLTEQGVQVTTIFDRLREDHGYHGSYGSVLRFVQRLRPVAPKVTVRVHTEPGEEAQVDFGNVGLFVGCPTKFCAGSERLERIA